MESNLSKLFVGGISWDTDEFRLKEYFKQFGEVVESVIMRDRLTGRARGFGFVVFSNSKAAERVVMEKHIIDGRKVEAKKAVPRKYQDILSRNNNGIHGSPRAGHSRKIFVGGLTSTVTESEFKKYFDQFGTITDVVVMYDQNTRRPRGFGFITYNSEDAVNRVLYKTFHELNGKMVEVKRAVPKELSPSPVRSPLVRYNSYGLDRSSNLISFYPPAPSYGFNSVGGYGQSNSVSGGRRGFGSIGASRYGVTMNMVSFYSGNYGLNHGFGNTHGGLISPHFSSHIVRYNPPSGYGGRNARDESLFSSGPQNVWGSGSSNNPTNPAGPGVLLRSGSGNFGAMFGSNRPDWVSSRMISQGGGNTSGYTNGTLGYGLEDRNRSLGNQGYGRITDSNIVITPSLSGLSSGLESPYGDSYGGSFVYGDSLGRNPELETSGLFGYGLGDGPSYGTAQTSEGYTEGYTVANRQPN